MVPDDRVKAPPEDYSVEPIEDVLADAGAGDGSQRATVRVRSSAWVFAAQMGRTALTIPMGVILARSLGAGGKGSVAVVQATAVLVVGVANIGMPHAIGWLAARGRASAQQAVALGALFAVTCAALFLALAGMVGPARLAGLLGLNSTTLLLLGIFATVPQMLATFEDAYLNGRGRVRDMQLTDVTFVAVQLVVFLVMWATHTLTPTNAVLVWLLCTGAGTAVKAWFAWRQSRHGAFALGPVWREGRAYGLKAWLGNTVNMMALRQDVVLLAMLGGTSQVGVYTIAVAAAELVWYIPNALQGVATAKFAAEEDSLELAQRLNRSVWPFTLLFAVAVLVLAIPLIPLVYGGAFNASIPPLIALLPGVLATSTATSLTAWLWGRGHPEDPAMANGVNMVVNLGANLLLDRQFGAVGAALASSISYTAGALLIMWRFKRRSGSRLRDSLVPRREDLAGMATVIGDGIRQRLRRKAAR